MGIPMLEQPRAHKQTASTLGASWIEWLARHPGLVLLGTLAVAILAFSEPPKQEEAELDVDGEEVPLFI